MKRLYSICAALLSISAHAADPESIERTLRTVGGAEYSVRLSQSAVSAASKSANFGHWGREGAVPAKCVSSMEVTRNGKAVGVPGKMFADLCNVRLLELSETKGRFVAKLKGGDAGDSFEAEYRFAGVYLTDRWVRHAEFPEDAYEHTRFKYNNSER